MYNFTAFSIRNLPGNEKLRQSAMAQEVEADGDDSVLKHFMIQKKCTCCKWWHRKSRDDKIQTWWIFPCYWKLLKPALFNNLVDFCCQQAGEALKALKYKIIRFPWVSRSKSSEKNSPPYELYNVLPVRTTATIKFLIEVLRYVSNRRKLVPFLLAAHCTKQ